MPDKMAAVADAAQALVAERYDIRKCAEDYEALYDSLCGLREGP